MQRGSVGVAGGDRAMGDDAGPGSRGEIAEAPADMRSMFQRSGGRDALRDAVPGVHSRQERNASQGGARDGLRGATGREDRGRPVQGRQQRGGRGAVDVGLERGRPKTSDEIPEKCSSEEEADPGRILIEYRDLIVCGLKPSGTVYP